MERLLAGPSSSRVGVICQTFEEYPHRLKQGGYTLLSNRITVT